ncbi:5694_t:CDS:1 [Entrophospora sp. SA101]|nr:6788_t:CDS:1 [Entrophospora sp. SA101]CAJ0632428.1 7498_t:CDS:1 [Entrophospora sp. SA101]CAJ0756611.1 5694_t:CDS:1 [Entrophospora sp. SA101]CAJ0846412.1 8182_t:CDS:1 [Entrophospora sp. SA101]CAJ0847615.1 15965_t:CDS:1 [Entrophospora sp. SA101]
MLLLPLMNINRFTILHQQQRRFIFQTLPVSRRLYDILEIPLDADKKLVKSQFYKLSKKYHPDLNLKDNTAHKKFLLINEAYSILINDKSRKEYDRSILFKNNNNKSFSRSWNHSQFSYSNRPNVRKHTHHNFHESNFRRRTSRTDDTHKTNNSNTSSSSSKDFKNKFNFQEHYQRHYSEELRRANSESSKEKNQSLENQLKSSHGRTVLRIVLIVSTLVLFGSSGGGIMI